MQNIMNPKLLSISILICVVLHLSIQQGAAQEVFEYIIYNKGDDPFSPMRVNAFCAYNGQLIIGGKFNSINRSNAQNIAVYNQGSWKQLGSGLNNPVNALIEYRGDLYAGLLQGVNKWDGENWIMVGGSSGGDALAKILSVTAMCVYNDNLYVCGMISGRPTNVGILKWDGINWSKIESHYKTFGPIDLEVYENNLYIMGDQCWKESGENLSFTKYPLITWDESEISRISFPDPPMGQTFRYSNHQIGKLLAVNGDLYMTCDAGLIKWDGHNFTEVFKSLGGIYDFIHFHDNIYIAANSVPKVVKINVDGIQFLKSTVNPYKSKLFEFDGKIFITIEEN